MFERVADFAKETYSSGLTFWGVLSTLAGILAMIPVIKNLLGKWFQVSNLLIYGGIISMWVGSFSAYSGQRDKVENLTRTLGAAQDQHPGITIKYAGIKEAKLSSGHYYNVEFTAGASGVHSAVAELQSMCLVENNKCSDKYNFIEGIKVGWHKEKESFNPLDLFKEEYFIPFFIYKNDKHIKVYASYKDSSFTWSDDLPQGSYRFSLNVHGKESTKTQCYRLNWYGDHNKMSIEQDNSCP